MIRTAVPQDIPALMDIYNEAVLHTTATFDTEVKDMENRKAWFAEHNGRYVIYVDEMCIRDRSYARRLRRVRYMQSAEKSF